MRSIDDENDELEELDNEELSSEDSLGPAFAKLLEKAKAKGFVSVDELNMAISAEQGPEAIEDAMSILSNLDIRVIDNDKMDDDEAIVNNTEDEKQMMICPVWDGQMIRFVCICVKWALLNC